MIVGVLGAGQLGLMLGLAGIPLGLRFRFLDPNPDSPAAAVGDLVVAPYDDEDALASLADGAGVVTYEFENVALSAAELLASRARLAPGAEALRVSQDRLVEKQALRDLGIQTAPFAAVDSEADLRAAARELGLPLILKTRRLGYDGKGQALVRTEAQALAAWSSMADAPGGVIAEGLVRFERELSLVAARGERGTTAFYPLVQNKHEGGILRETLAPAPGVGAGLQREAEGAAAALMDRLGYRGVLAIEWFDVGGRLVANEFAPRVHNSGHWTIEGAETSQFENHLRAVCGWPLGSTAPRGASLMRNAIGAMPGRAEVLAVAGAHVHDYGKAPRAGRKVGHVTLRREDVEGLEAAKRKLDGAWGEEGQ